MRMLNIVDLYRVEHKDTGIGPFCMENEDGQFNLDPGRHSEYRRMPPPYSDGMKLNEMTIRQWFFAFPDYETCRGFWEDSTVRDLMSEYHLVHYQINGKHVVHGRSGLQVAFKRRYSRKVGVMELQTLIKG